MRMKLLRNGKILINFGLKKTEGDTKMVTNENRTEVKDIGNYIVAIVEERRGLIQDELGYVHATHNCYAGIGYELSKKGEKTGKIIAWAGDGADGEVCEREDLDLDAYLYEWDDVEQFVIENILA